MASGFVHQVQTLIALGRRYAHIHERKDEPARWRPGTAHRRLRHRWYQMHGTNWNIDDTGSDVALKRLDRVQRLFGSEKADEYIASLGHDHLNVVWDCPQLSRTERRFTRKYWEAFHAWMVLHPELLRTWAGVDVVTGRVHRVIDGQELWEDDDEVRHEYARLRRRAHILARRDRVVSSMLQAYGQDVTAGVADGNR